MEDSQLTDYKSEHQKRLKMLSLQALMVMLAIILLPPLLYSINLLRKSTTADEIVVAISIGVFASVVYLWILDATGILPFRSTWISKAVYGAAIASILCTSAAVYQGYFVGDKYPYRGAWELMYGPYVFKASISYSLNSETYWGYTDMLEGEDKGQTPWFRSIEIKDFNPEEKVIVVLDNINGTSREMRFPISIKRNGKLIESAGEEGPILRLKREN